MDLFMRDSDAFSWYMESDPVLRSTVVAVTWLDRSPDWEELLAREVRATRLIPMFRQRVVEPPARMGPPRWAADPEFDMSWHFRRMDAPAPGTDQVVLDLARREAMTAFDRAHPLWQFTLVEGLEGGRAALVMKIHHSLTDGLGGMQLALLLFDTARRPHGGDAPSPAPEHRAPQDGWPAASDGSVPGAAGLARDGLAHEAARLAGLAGGAVKGLVPGAAHLARHPVAGTRSAAATVSSVARTVAPVNRTLSPVMTGRGLGRHLDLVEVRLSDLKRASVAAGGTLNDGFLAAVTGGLRRYHEHHGAPVDQLRMTMPISIRTAGDPLGGNRITLMRFTVPVGETDPAARMAEIDRRCRAARCERSLPLTNGIAGALNLLPAGFVGAMLRHVDFLASDVPGFPLPVYLAGARVDRYVAFGPTTGSSVNTTLLSYNGTCGVGINIDTAAVPDAGVLVDSLAAGFGEVLRLAGRHGPVRVPLRPVAAAA